MNRRGFLRGTAVAGTVGLAGCLEWLGFEEQSAWDNPPLVENRPDAVYLPAGMEQMNTYGRATDGEYAVALSYTIPHRFWIIAGETEQVGVEPDDSMHLMLTAWDVETDTVLPVNLSLEILHDGDSVSGQLSPWPMISQRMGFHYGDNISFPEEGEYTARIQVGPIETERTGAFEDRLDSSTTLEIDFEFSRSDIHDLEFDLIDDDRRGNREALPLMDHGEHGNHGDSHEDGDEEDDHGNGNHDDHDLGTQPTSDGPPVDELPGEVLVTERSGDAKLSVLVPDSDRFADSGTSLIVCLRTPYNDISLPFASLSAEIERDGTSVLEDGPLTLSETLDHEFGHHYGALVTEMDGLESGDEITVSVDSPPQVSRHDGYETAFFEFEDVSVIV